jgi:hypothetical protein
MSAGARETMSIWFFCGVMLLAYGLIICATGVWETSHPLLNPPALANLNAPIWWGALLAIAGLAYVIRFFPRKHSRL